MARINFFYFRELSRIGSQDEGAIGLPPIPIQASTRIDLDAIMEVDVDQLLPEKKIKKKPLPPAKYYIYFYNIRII